MVQPGHIWDPLSVGTPYGIDVDPQDRDPLLAWCIWCIWVLFGGSLGLAFHTNYRDRVRALPCCGAMQGSMLDDLLSTLNKRAQDMLPMGEEGGK